jgi:hypothetical protein
VIALPTRPPLRRTENTVQAEIRAALASVPGVVTFRNNVGALRDETGRLVSYGLAVGSSDLVVCAWGRFVAIEVKIKQPAWMRPGSRAQPSKHEQEQLTWIAQVEAHGGVGGIAWDVPTALAILDRARP